MSLNHEQPSVDKDRSIGEIISNAFNLSEPQLQQILQHQKTNGVKFGEAAVSLGMIKREDVLWALSQQFHYPYSNQNTGQDQVSEELVVATQPFGEYAEIFRDVRSQLLMEAPQGLARRAIAVVSPGAGDGKSFFASNLAVAFSQLGGRTVLVDADMRTPRQHEIFGIDGASSGLSGVLSGRTETNVIRPVQALPNLYVMPVGTIPPNPLELIQRPAFGMMLQELLSKFEHVIVDSAAANRGADAKLIAATCGSALVLGRKNVTKMNDLNDLVKAISKNSKVLGMLINDF